MSTPQAITELEEVTQRFEAIVKEVAEDGPTPEQQAEMDALHGKAIGLKARIEEAKTEKQRKDMAELGDFLAKPQYQAPRAINDDDDGRKTLRQMGWDVKNGIVIAPTSLGKSVEMFGEDVLFGPMPERDPEARKYFATMRTAFQPGYREAYEKFLRVMVEVRSESMAWTKLTAAEQKALSEGTDTAGGFTVPPDVQAEMLVRLPQFSVMRRLARTITTSRDVVKYPRVQAASATAGGVAAGGGSIFTSGFVGTWVGETPAFSETDPAFGTFDITIKKARAATKLSNDLISDSAVNLLAFMAQNGAENLGLVEDKGFIDGDGAALQPLGILNGGAATVDVEGTTSNTISNTSADLGSATKLITLQYALPSQYAGNARWIMRRAVEAEIRKLVDANNRYLWPALSGSGLAGSPRTLLDDPVENSEFVPDDGTDANKVLIYGDIGSYIIAQRAQISTVILRERFADTEQVGIILIERVGGGLWNEDGIRIGVV